MHLSFILVHASKRNEQDVNDENIGDQVRKYSQRIRLKRLELERKHDWVDNEADEVDDADAQVPHHFVLVLWVNNLVRQIHRAGYFLLFLLLVLRLLLAVVKRVLTTDLKQHDQDAQLLPVFHSTCAEINIVV